MDQLGLINECKDLEQIINDLAIGKETCEISDECYSVEDAVDYLRGFLQELKDLNAKIVDQGNSPEPLEILHNKYM